MDIEGGIAIAYKLTKRMRKMREKWKPPKVWVWGTSRKKSEMSSKHLHVAIFLQVLHLLGFVGWF